MKIKTALWTGWCAGWFLFGFLMMGGCDEPLTQIPKQQNTGVLEIPGVSDGNVRVMEIQMNGNKYIVAQGYHGVAICPVPITQTTTTLEITK